MSLLVPVIGRPRIPAKIVNAIVGRHAIPMTYLAPRLRSTKEGKCDQPVHQERLWPDTWPGECDRQVLDDPPAEVLCKNLPLH
jgi:hypothetical protein